MYVLTKDLRFFFCLMENLYPILALHDVLNILSFTDKKFKCRKTVHCILISCIGACTKGEAAEKGTPLCYHIMSVAPVIKLGSQWFYNSFLGF